MLDNLYPILGEHSINRSIISLYLPQMVLKPEKLFEKLNIEYFTKKYQRRDLVYSRKISLINKNNTVSVIDDKINENIVGFIFEEFNYDGIVENILILKNENNKANISFETRNYKGWQIFFDKFLIDLKNIINQQDFYFEAISLTYEDEFIWKSDNKIPVEGIFEKNSELINVKFLNSTNGTIVLFSQNEDNNIEEKTEISFNNDSKRVQIIHQHVTKFQDILDSITLNTNIKDKLEIAHLSNKTTLNGLLTKEVKQKINLN
jgi:hypothetical protein